MSDLFGIRHAYREASENILVAATHEGTNRDFRLAQARDDIARGFCPEAPVGEGREALIDAIEETLLGLDVFAARGCAIAIVNELFKHLKPEGV